MIASFLVIKKGVKMFTIFYLQEAELEGQPDRFTWSRLSGQLDVSGRAAPAEEQAIVRAERDFLGNEEPPDSGFD